MIHIGFTGSAHRVTDQQRLVLVDMVSWFDLDSVVHHGDCVEADALFDELCAGRNIRREAHPGHDGAGNSPARAYCQAEVIHAPLPYLVRNKVIVSASDLLIAVPSGPERQRSGTWSTVRRARERDLHLHVVWPDGSVT